MSTVGKVEKGYIGGLFLIKELGSYVGRQSFFQTEQNDIYDTISISMYTCSN